MQTAFKVEKRIAFAFSEIEGSGTLELAPVKKDTFGSPLARISIKMTDWDKAGYELLKEYALKIADAMGAEHISELSPIGSGFGYHPSGTSAMGNNPDNGVCDKNLKIFGLDSLYIVSNSIFTTNKI